MCIFPVFIGQKSRMHTCMYTADSCGYARIVYEPLCMSLQCLKMCSCLRSSLSQKHFLQGSDINLEFNTLLFYLENFNADVAKMMKMLYIWAGISEFRRNYELFEVLKKISDKRVYGFKKIIFASTKQRGIKQQVNNMEYNCK